MSSSAAFVRLIFRFCHVHYALSLLRCRAWDAQLATPILALTHYNDSDSEGNSGNNVQAFIAGTTASKEDNNKNNDNSDSNGEPVPSTPESSKARRELFLVVEQIILHGLSFTSCPTYGASQVRRTCKALMKVVADLCNLALHHRLYKYSDAMMATVSKLREIEWYKRIKEVRAKNADECAVLVARAWIRCAMSVKGALHSYCVLLLHAASRKAILEAYFSPWSLWRSDSNGAPLKGAMHILSRISYDHVVGLSVGSRSVVDYMRKPPSQWWPLPFACWKSRMKFDEEYNPKNKKAPTAMSAAAEPAPESHQRRQQQRQQLQNVTSSGFVISPPSTIEEGMDAFADALDHGLAAAMNYCRAGSAKGSAHAMGHIPFNKTNSNVTLRSKPCSLFGSPISLISKSLSYCGPISTYDSSLAAPVAILSLMKTIKESVDMPGIFQCASMRQAPTSFEMNALSNCREVRVLDIPATSASNLLIHWFRSLPFPLVANRSGLTSAMLLPESDRRRNIRLLLESSLPPPSSIIFLELLSLLNLATQQQHCRRNELTTMKCSLLIAPAIICDVTTWRAQKKYDTDNPNNDDMGGGSIIMDLPVRKASLATGIGGKDTDLGSEVEACDVLRFILEDVEYFTEGIKEDIALRRSTLNDSLDGIMGLLRLLEHSLVIDNATIKTRNDAKEGNEEVTDEKLLRNLATILKDKFSTTAEQAQLPDREFLKTFNALNDETTNIPRAAVLATLHFAGKYPGSAKDVFEKLQNNSQSLIQFSSQFSLIVTELVGLSALTSETLVAEVPAPAFFKLLCSSCKEASALSDLHLGAAASTVLANKSALMFCELTSICWLILQSNFEDGMACVREGIGGTLMGRPVTIVECLERFVKWKERRLLHQANGNKASQSRKEQPGHSPSPSYNYFGKAGRIMNGSGARGTSVDCAMYKNSCLLSKVMLSQLSRSFPHYVQRRNMLKGEIDPGCLFPQDCLQFLLL